MNGLPARWRRFYARQAAALAASALLLAWVFHATPLDVRAAAPWYDAARGDFPWRHAWFTWTFVHRDLKLALVALGVVAWAAMVAGWLGHAPRALAGYERRWRVLALSFALVPAVSALVRAHSLQPCPWDVVGFGGAVPYFDLLSPMPPGVAPGHCFPAGFVTAGSWLLALPLLWLPRWPRRARLAWLGVLAFSLALGWVQQARGAHFLSHTLWSLWLSWALVLALHAACGAWREGGDRAG